MTQDTLYSIAIEMLRTTNVYKKEIEKLVYRRGYGTKSLVDLVRCNLSDKRSGYRNRSQVNLRIAYKAIESSLIEYWENYPSSFSFKQRMKIKFAEWLTRIQEQYKIVGEEIPDEIKVHHDELDTAIVMIKELHARNGVTKEELCEKLVLNHPRSVQKNLRKLSPSLYEGGCIEKDNVYAPFRLGGQPLLVEIEAVNDRSDNKKRYRTKNTLHPIVLQENLMQVATMLQALSRNYDEYESNISTTVAIDIWSQLSDYAKRRIESYYTLDDESFSDFIELLKDECPDNHVSIFNTERQMVNEIDMPLDETILYLIKAPGRYATVIYTDEDGKEVCLQNQRISYSGISDERKAFKLVSEDGASHIVNQCDIKDIIIEKK